MTDYERIGGADGLTAIFEDFIPLVAEDFIIGFMFQGKDLRRIRLREIELAAIHLGGPSMYAGRPLAAVHKPLPINRGHFRRRMALLRKVLASHQVDGDVIERWVGQDEALVDQILARDIDCV